MGDLKEKCLDTFPGWLRNLGESVEVVLAVIEAAGVPDPVRRQLIAGVNYLFKSLDLIPDGIDDIGYLDDAFVLRVAADLVKDGDLGKTAEDKVRSLKVLAGEADLVREFLEASTYDRLVRYTKDLVKGSARGRSVDDIATSPDVFREFASEVRSFSSGYESPSFSREEKNLIKLRAFFEAKLPR